MNALLDLVLLVDTGARIPDGQVGAGAPMFERMVLARSSTAFHVEPIIEALVAHRFVVESIEVEVTKTDVTDKYGGTGWTE